MRIGLIADIHGNLVALESVVAELARDGVDGLLCLGDIATPGPHPAAVVARLRELGCASVKGNTDAWLVDGLPPTLSRQGTSGVAMAEIAQWCGGTLAPEDHAYLATCPPTHELQLSATRHLLAFHGSPRSFDDVIAATTPDAELAAMLAGQHAEVLVGGHTHVQLCRRFGDALVINPGSVGLPGIGPGTPELPVNIRVAWAEYAVLEAEAGRLSIDLRRTPVDIPRMLADARTSGMPRAEWWASLWGQEQPAGRR